MLSASYVRHYSRYWASGDEQDKNACYITEYIRNSSLEEVNTRITEQIIAMVYLLDSQDLN